MPSAAQLIASLVSDVELDDASVDQSQRIMNLALGSDECDALISALRHASSGERTQLSRVIADAARRLAAVSDRLLDSWRAGGLLGRNAVMPRLLGAVALASFFVAHNPDDTGALDPVFSCASLAWGPGAAILAELAAGQAPPAREEIGPVVLRTQVALLSSLVDVALARGSGQALARHLPSRQLLAWLDAAVRTARVLHGPMLTRGSPPILVPDLCSMLMGLRIMSAFEPHVSELQGNQALQRTLLEKLLLPALHTCAVAAQLPPERRPASFDWKTVLSAAGCTAVVISQPVLYGVLAASGVCPRLVQSVVALLEHMPTQQPAGFTELHYHLMQRCTWDVLAHACRSLAALDVQQQCQAVRSMLPAVQRLPAWLEHVAAVTSAAERAELCASCVNVGVALQRACEDRATAADAPSSLRWAARGLEDLPAFCAAASAMLRALPRALALTADAGAGRAASVARALPDALLLAAAEVAAMSASCCMHLQAGAASVPAGTPSAADALWLLHSTCCRLVQHEAAGSLLQPANSLQLLSLLQHTYIAVSWLHPDPEARTAAERKRLDAMGAAQCWAALALGGGLSLERVPHGAGSSGLLLALPRCVLLCMRGQAAFAAPLLASEALQQLLAALMERAEQQGVFASEVVPSAPLAFLAARDGLTAWVALLESAIQAPGDARCVASDLLVQKFTPPLQALSQVASDSLLAAQAAGAGAVGSQLRQALQAYDAALTPLLQQYEQRTIAARELAAEMRRSVRPAARALGVALWAWHQRPEQQAAQRLELAHAAAARSCAYLLCANLAGEGGPAAGQGAGSSKCSGCREAWYCSEACQHADWRQGGHRRCCKVLAAEHAERWAARRAAAAAAAGGSANP